MGERPLSGFLEGMRSRKRHEVRKRRRRRSAKVLERIAADREPPPGFAAALRSTSPGKMRIIAEMKKASPSAGVIRKAFDPLHLARQAVEAGAAAVSVLTEEEFFQGSLEDLRRVAAGVPAPVLRKDFIIDTYQILEAGTAGAAACLLIAAMLPPPQLRLLMRDLSDLGMTALVEAHDRRDLDDALEAEAPIIGINNRNLKTLEVDLRTTFELQQYIPGGKIVVSESGLRIREDIAALEEAGIDAVLVGEAIMRAEDVGRKIREFLGEPGEGTGGPVPGAGTRS